MSKTIGPGSPCTAEVIPGEDGGLSVTLAIPTYNGVRRLTLAAERNNPGDRDWVIYLPSTSDYEDDGDGTLLYMGAPDVERPAEPEARDD